MNDTQETLATGTLRRALWAITALGLTVGWATACTSGEHEEVVIEGVTVDAVPVGDSVLLTETRWVEVVDAGDALRRAREQIQRDDDEDVADALTRVAGGLRIASKDGFDAEDSARLKARATGLEGLAKDLEEGVLHDGAYIGQVFARAHSTLSRHYLARARQHADAGMVAEAGQYVRKAVMELESAHHEAGTELQAEAVKHIADARALAGQWVSGSAVTEESKKILSALEADQRRLANGLGARVQ